ncbi:tight junction-associated protein 1-like isoform X1 [Saccostrea echinata]|uniref:tight junction-associated protein 1-like isoform X1 n=1 Tax=Saccostrea echinata TaxID=191078 RepID=UPI002A81D727|nr:tight junction-associated protein 1-like isoform X1 [Saccostrea echinata]
MFKRQPPGMFQQNAKVCQECGCPCTGCMDQSSLDLHQKIVELESELRKSNEHVSKIGRELMDNKQLADYEVHKLREELNKLRDRYDRLFESHKRIQKVNHGLEDKILKIVSGFEEEKTNLQRELATTTSRLVDAKATVCELEEENERYRNDCNIAVQLLQCKPSEFVSHKLNSLPIELQERVKKHMTREEIINCEDAPNSKEAPKLIHVPMATFPPTAMVYSVNKPMNKSETSNTRNGASDGVPMDVITKALSHPEPIKKSRRTYICLKCRCDVVCNNKETQVNMSRETQGSCDNLSELRVHRPCGRTQSFSSESEMY